MDRSLDEIISDRPRGRPSRPEPRRGALPPRAPRRDEGPRDGVRKYRRDENSNIDTDWVHDRYEEERRYDQSRRGGHSPVEMGRNDRAPRPDERGSKIRVDNLHYELTEKDLSELFSRIGRVADVKLLYDRMDRSEGTAFVTYEDPRDAKDAVAEFNGQNANGQVIRLSILPTAPAPKGNLFDRVERPSRSLFDRIEGGPDSPDDSREDARRPRRRRSESPHRKMTLDNIDRYVPGGRRPRSRSLPRRRGTPRGGGRRPGQTKDDRGGAGRRGRTDDEGKPMAGGRPKKTAAELDAEMADYWGKSTEPASAANGSAPTQNGTSNAATSGMVDEDIDMIE